MDQAHSPGRFKVKYTEWCIHVRWGTGITILWKNQDMFCERPCERLWMHRFNCIDHLQSALELMFIEHERLHSQCAVVEDLIINHFDDLENPFSTSS
jgi:hypothetical protein